MRNIFDLLLESKYISDSTVKMLNQFCKRWQVSEYHALLETQVFSETLLADLLAKLLQMNRILNICPCLSYNKFQKPLLTYEKAKEWECFPSYTSENKNDIEIVIADPTKRERFEYFRNNIEGNFYFSIGERSEINEAIDRYYPLEDQIESLRNLEKGGK